MPTVADTGIVVGVSCGMMTTLLNTRGENAPVTTSIQHCPGTAGDVIVTFTEYAIVAHPDQFRTLACFRLSAGNARFLLDALGEANHTSKVDALFATTTPRCDGKPGEDCADPLGSTSFTRTGVVTIRPNERDGVEVIAEPEGGSEDGATGIVVAVNGANAFHLAAKNFLGDPEACPIQTTVHNMGILLSLHGPKAFHATVTHAEVRALHCSVQSPTLLRLRLETLVKDLANSCLGKPIRDATGGIAPDAENLHLVVQQCPGSGGLSSTQDFVVLSAQVNQMFAHTEVDAGVESLVDHAFDEKKGLSVGFGPGNPLGVVQLSACSPPTTLRITKEVPLRLKTGPAWHSLHGLNRNSVLVVPSARLVVVRETIGDQHLHAYSMDDGTYQFALNLGHYTPTVMCDAGDGHNIYVFLDGHDGIFRVPLTVGTGVDTFTLSPVHGTTLAHYGHRFPEHVSVITANKDALLWITTAQLGGIALPEPAIGSAPPRHVFTESGTRHRVHSASILPDSSAALVITDHNHAVACLPFATSATHDANRLYPIGDTRNNMDNTLHAQPLNSNGLWYMLLTQSHGKSKRTTVCASGLDGTVLALGPEALSDGTPLLGTTATWTADDDFGVIGIAESDDALPVLMHLAM
jgi:hypothetical protein